MFLDLLLDVLFTPAPQRLGNINRTRDIGNGRKTSDKTLSPYAKRVGMIALVLAVACMAPDSFAQTAKESIDVPPHSRLLLRAVGSGDQVYGCVNGSWALKAPDAEFLNQEGSVIGSHAFAVAYGIDPAMVKHYPVKDLIFQGFEEATVFFGKVNTYLDDHVSIERIVDGGDLIAVIGRGHGTARDTGGPFDVPIMHLWAFKDRLAVRLEVVLDVPTMQAALQARTQVAE